MVIKVEAIIREEKLNDVLDALVELDVHGVTCYQVMGCGTQRGLKEYAYMRGHQQVEIQMLPKIKIEVLVSSEQWEQKTIEVIQKAAYTGSIGDGKIFSYDVREAMRIRTKETGYDAIQPE
ncbi:MAG: P-II family nitrogen regulator [Ruminococcus sp.]|nr:P-II family nitrogen regulator [Ruminococcus sp.]